MVLEKNYQMSDVEKRLFQKLESIQKSCGQVCNTRVTGRQGKYYEELTKDVDCDALFSNPLIDEPSEYLQPPPEIPFYLYPDYSYNGRIKIVPEYRNEAKSFSNVVWTKETVDKYVSQYQSGNLEAGYGKESIADLIFFLDNHVNVTGKTVLVIGSLQPWLEALLLLKGATYITTFDYNKITNHHPQIQTLLPHELAQRYFDGLRFDVMATFSSIEHSGLGRYGDALNPWGDLIAMARAWCFVKPGGEALVGLPSGPDMMGFNSHRIYGRVMYGQLFANWAVKFTNTDFSRNDGVNCYYCFQFNHALTRL